MSTTFSITAGQLVASALRLQGYIQQGDTPSATLYTNMVEALNILVKAWSSRGLKVWTVVEETIPLTLDQRSMTIGDGGDVDTDRPLRIEECFIRYNVSSDTPTDVTLQPLSRNEYQMLGNKFTTGTPNSYFYDPLIPLGKLYWYVVPDQEAEDDMEIHIFMRKQLDDIADEDAELEFPSEWYQALRWNLADETSLDNQIPESVADRIAERAKRLKEEMEGWDREYTSVFIQPDLRR